MLLSVQRIESYDGLPKAWQERFTFYDRFGAPNTTPKARQAYRALPFLDKARLTVNIWAFLFGPVYFFVKGMWRKGLILLAVAVALVVVLIALDAPDNISRGAALIVPAFALTTANYAYYLHAVKGSQSWNIFQGFGRL